MIEAAGGVVWRTSNSCDVEVLLVHRPRQDDWSLPKGKRRPSESMVECALREVHEETGLICKIGAVLPPAFYRDRKGRAKRVRYWAMQEQSGEFTPNDEVDSVSWLRLELAAEVLTYDRDLVVVTGLYVAHAAVA